MIYYFFWPGICLKLETVDKFIKSKKIINKMHIYDYRGGDISEQYTLLYNPYSLACKEINIITNLSTMQRSTMQSIMQPFQNIELTIYQETIHSTSSD